VTVTRHDVIRLIGSHRHAGTPPPWHSSQTS